MTTHYLNSSSFFRASRALRGFGSLQRLAYALFLVAAGLFALGATGHAAIYTWSATAGTNTWATGANWFGGNAAVSGSTTDLEFGSGSAGYTATNNNSGAFKLNILGLSGSSTTASQTNIIQSGTLEFIANGGVNPVINRSWTGTSEQFSIKNAVILTNDLTISGAATGALTFNSGGISGAGAIVNNTGANLVMVGANTFTGGVTTYTDIYTQTTGALGSGTLTLGNGVKWVISSTAQSVANSIVLTGTSAGSTTSVKIDAQAAPQVINGSINLNGRDLQLWNSTATGSSLTVNGAISGTGNLTTNYATGRWYLTGNNTFSGNISVPMGALTMSGSNTYAAGTTVGAATTSGTVVLGNANGLGSANGALTLTNGTLDLNGYSVAVGTLSGSSTGIITSGTTGAVTLTASSASNSTLSGAINNGSGTVALSKGGAGTLTLSGSNAYGGGTTLTSGSLVVGNANALGSSSGDLAVNGGTLNLNGNSVTVGALSGLTGAVINSGTAGAVTFTSSFASGTSTYAGSIGNGSGTVALAKSGAGTLVLSSSNSYSGGTTLSAGSLVIGNAASLGATTGTLTLNGGTLDLNGNSVTVGVLSGLTGAAINSGTSGAVTFTTSFTSGTSTYAGSIGNGSGTVALAKSGAGTLVLSSSNSYSGGTTLSAGSLVAGNANALGSGALSVTGGAIDLSGNSVNVGATSLSSGGIVSTGIAGAASLVITATTASTFSGSIADGAGTVSLVKNGSGELILGGSNSYSGGTTINGGLFTTSVAGAIGSGTLALGANVKWTLKGVSQSYSNNVAIGAANAAIQVDGAGVTGTLSGNIALNSYTLTLRNASGPGGAISGVITGLGGITSNPIDPNDTWVLSGNNTYTGSTTWTAGRLTLSGSNTYTGGTTIGAATTSGTIVLGNANGLGATTGALTVTNGLLDLNGNSVAVGALSGTSTGTISTGTVGSVTLTASSASTSTFSGVITNGSGTVALTKSGAGTLTLAGASTYTGATNVSGGKLVVSGSLSGNTAVTVASGAELNVNGLVNTAASAMELSGTLTGVGTVGAVNATGGKVSPGNSAIAIGTINTGALSLDGTAHLAIEIGRTVAGGGTLSNDQVSVIGSVTLADGADLQLSLASGQFNPKVSDVLFLVVNDSSDSVSGVFTKLNGAITNLAEGSQFTYNSVTYQISYVANFGGGSANDISLTALAIPEPETWAILAAGFGMLIGMQKIRHRAGR